MKETAQKNNASLKKYGGIWIGPVHCLMDAGERKSPLARMSATTTNHQTNMKTWIKAGALFAIITGCSFATVSAFGAEGKEACAKCCKTGCKSCSKCADGKCASCCKS